MKPIGVRNLLYREVCPKDWAPTSNEMEACFSGNRLGLAMCLGITVLYHAKIVSWCGAAVSRWTCRPAYVRRSGFRWRKRRNAALRSWGVKCRRTARGTGRLKPRWPRRVAPPSIPCLAPWVQEITPTRPRLAPCPIQEIAADSRLWFGNVAEKRRPQKRVAPW